jgi:hypothetical protein
MKNKFNYVILLLLALNIAGCSNEFLETAPTEVITEEQFGESDNPNLLQGLINGAYTTMFSTGSGGTTGHTDFGQKGVDIYTDMLCGDMALTGVTYGWYSDIVNFEVTTDFTSTGNYVPWRYYYRIIRSANTVIVALGGDNAVLDTPQRRHFMGQMKALRAYAYFYLTQIYVREYNPTAMILPIYTSTNQVSLPKSSTEDVFNQIIKDLTESITLLDDFERTAKTAIDKNVAKGLLAYTYAAMGDNAQVKTITNDIIATAGYPLTTASQLTGGFNDVNTASWMWGVDLTTAQSLDLISWWGQIDYFTFSYASVGDHKVIDNALFASIPATDLRKRQFSTASATALLPLNKFYAPGRTVQGQRIIETDYIYMRIDEMYVLNAEASAKTGDEGGARSRLASLLTSRLPGGTDYLNNLSGQALLDEIYKQTRIEFWGEGKSYLAMKRNQRTVTRGTNHLYQVGIAIPYNDPRLTFKIPQAEFQANPNITEQN